MSSKDLDRACKACGKQGLSKASKTGLCARCYRKLPFTAKAGFLALNELAAHHVGGVRRVFGPQADRVLGLGGSALPELDLELAPWAGASPPDPAEVDLDGAPSWATRIAEFTQDESPTQRLRREGRRAKRASAVRYVPDDGVLGGFEQPARVVVGLWGHGFGLVPIAQILTLNRITTASSSIGRLLVAVQRPTSGPAVRVGDLVDELTPPEANELEKARDRLAHRVRLAELDGDRVRAAGLREALRVVAQR